MMEDVGEVWLSLTNQVETSGDSFGAGSLPP
jgi:hypothetical protein